ncbi:MAG TPA: hypothetical protein VIT88_03585 [Pyrinomonadaceae bacterium]
MKITFTVMSRLSAAQKLKDRLELLVTYQIKQQWSKQYDLFSSLRRRAEGKADYINLTRKEYANGWKSPLVSFTTRSINLVQVDRTTKLWMITGCAEVREKHEGPSAGGHHRSTAGT